MARVNLTDRAVQAAKAEPGTRLELHDALMPGLTLRVTEHGGKSWVLRYKQPGTRRTQRFKLGDAKRMALKSARLEAGRLKDLIAKGGDPFAEQRQAIEAERAIVVRTYGDLEQAYWEACEAGTWKPKRKKKRPQTLAYEKRLANRHIPGSFRKLPLIEIKRGTVERILTDMIALGIGAQTNRVHAIIRQVFAFGVAKEHAAANPAQSITALHDNVPRRTTWSDAGLAALWKACEAPTELRDAEGQRVYVSRAMAIAVQLSALTLQRRVEVAHMQPGEVDFQARTWVIPGERMKGGRPHQVPLGQRAVALIREAVGLAQGEDDKPPAFVFPSPLDRSQPVREDAVTKALAKMRKVIGVTEGHVHDLRRTGSSVMTSERLGISPFIRSKVLGHETDTGGGASVSSVHYDVNEYLPEKRRALEAWESLLLEIVGERPRNANVQPLREAVK